MNPRLKAAHEKLNALIAEGKALQESEAHDETQKERYAALPDEIAAARKEIVDIQQMDAHLGEANEFLNGNKPASIAANLKTKTYQEETADIEQMRRLRTRAKYFGMISENRAEAQLKAYRFGMFVRASLLKDETAVRFCKDNGIPVSATQTETNNEDGGALVVPEFENDIIVLREKFGLYRQFARYTPMNSDTKSRPRRRGGLVAYHVNSQQAAALSKAQWDRVELVAKKIMVLAQFETELGEDATVDFGDTLAGEMAYACSVREDTDGFVGDGLSDSGGIIGLAQAMINVYTTGGGLGLVQGTAPSGSLNHWTALSLEDFAKVKGALPEYTEKLGDIAWYCHKAFFEEVMAPIALSAGGVTAAEIVAGIRRRFMGYDVRVTQIMPNSPAADQIPVYFGALELSSMFGDRRMTRIAFSEHAQFEDDLIVAKCTERYDIVNHDVGTSTQAGPVVGLVTQ